MMSDRDATRKRRTAEADAKQHEQETFGEHRPVKHLRLSNDDEEKSENSNSSKNFIPTPQGTPAFLPFHVEILRTLYHQDSSALENGPNKAPREDGTVDDRFWEMANNYLKQRGNLRGMKYESDYYRNIHKEALQVVLEQDRILPSQRKSISMALPPIPIGTHHPTSHAVSLSMLSSGSQQSPHSNRYPNATLSSSQILSENGIPGGHHRRRSFGVVASLLERKFKIADSRLLDHTTPFQPLLFEVERRRTTLRKLLCQHEHAILKGNKNKTMELLSPENHSTKANSSDEDLSEATNAEESIARLETKFRLWDILYFDLKDSA